MCFDAFVNVEVTDCVIIAVQVIQAPSLTSLVAQNYALSSNTQYNYQLGVRQTPSCNYTSSDLTIAIGSPISGTSPGEYSNLDPNSGLYSITPGRSRGGIGFYTIHITGVTLNG